MARIVFVTGTDTGVGKTLFAVLLARSWRADGQRIAALKPISSGTREDARALREAASAKLTLDEVNPWHFRAPISPLLAARRERRLVTRAAVVQYVRKMHNRFPMLIVEGAGGLLSPLGKDFDSRDLIADLDALPIVVSSNRLGAVNQVRLVVEALPARARRSAHIVLMSPKRPDASTRSNADLLCECFDRDHVHVLPWLQEPADVEESLSLPKVRAVMRCFRQR